jgi:aspartyl-tRNA(Asn)/glutamyl-tRNA(Gln) amidotransferase subunit A
MNKEDICYMPAWEMAEKIKTQELTSLEITETLIERIEKINPIINAYCTPTFELARDMAKAADDRVKKGEKLGILNGIPTSIKELYDTKGIRTTYCSKIYENNIPEEDAIVVKRLKEAGIVILGKTNSPEFGHKATTDNLLFGVTKNPWNLNKTPGGSSGGAAAAVASGLGPLALGGDAGGSIRIPSSICGIYGLKPQFGRIPRPFSKIALSSLAHYGPLVRYVKDAALMLDAMAGPHEKDKYSLPQKDMNFLDSLKDQPKNLKIGYSLDLGYVRAIDPEVEKCVIDAVQKFQEFGWTVEKAKIKFRKVIETFASLLTSGFVYDLKPYLKEWRDKMSPTFVQMLDFGKTITVSNLQSTILARTKMYEVLNQYFKNFDLLITPTTAVPTMDLGQVFVPKIAGKSVSPAGWVPFTSPFNMTWIPAASIPCGWSKEGIPIGMQIIGKRFDEKTVLQVSKAFEEIQPWQDKKPQLN